MTHARARSILTLAVALSAAAILAGCTADTSPEPTSTPASPVAGPTSTASADPTVSTTAPSGATCDSILPPDTVADFEEVGWTAQEEPFHIGGIELQGGIQCKWGDYSVATDHVQIFGWAPISDEDSSAAQDELLSSGWRREDSADGVYITESADTAIATDAEGYGMTYLFGDGWVTIADTKQGLILIEPPTT